MSYPGLGLRLIVAILGIPVILAPTYFGGALFTILIGAICLISMYEYYRLQAVAERKPLRWIGLAGGFGIIAIWHFDYNYLLWFLILFTISATFSCILKKRTHLDCMVTIGGVIYIPLLIGSFIFIRNGQGEIDASVYNGKTLSLCIWGAIWIGDTAAYAVGKAIGKRPLAPATSPNKSIEGFIAGLAGSALFSLIWWKFGFTDFDLALCTGIAAGTIGQMGDLFESKLKREAGVKDSGSFLPGHGGILDRFDSLLTTAPVIALYLVVRHYIF